MRSLRVLAAVLSALCFAPAIALAQGPSGAPGLDRLLRIPDSVEFSSERKGGATRSEWRERFTDARKGVDDAQVALDKAMADLSKVAGSKSEWQMTPPGLAAQPSEDSSSSFQLRQAVKRERGELERARARLRELEVEANLAGVPDEWRRTSTVPRSGNQPGDESATGPASTR